MHRRLWKIRCPDESAAELLAKSAKLSLPIARLLSLRGFRTREEVENFLNPRLSDLSDPSLLPDMDKAVNRLWRAIDGGKRITVFGDYDVDGMTASALLTCVLRALGAEVNSFIPNRLKEGYGLSKNSIERCLGGQRPELIVSVDCGTNAVESVTFAQKRGVDVIVTDHHEPGTETAPCFALINPKLGTIPPLKNLSGAGVAFKLAHALVKTGREQHKNAAEKINLRDYLDMAALGTVADLVPLVKENRIMVRHGIMQFTHSKWAGLEALKDVSGLRDVLETSHIAFQLAPRINAAGRIGYPMQALQLLLTDDVFEAERIAKQLDEINTNRRRIEKEMTKEVFEEIDDYFNPDLHYGLVAARKGWHPGVVGIVASRAVRRYNRPSIVMAIEEDGRTHGSCRSIEEYHMLEGLQACEAELSQFGGHSMAAGLEVKQGRLKMFRTSFNKAVAAALEKVDLSPKQPIDAVVKPEEIDQDFWEQLKKLRPFGQKNPEPVWMMLQMQAAGLPQVVGKHHLRLSLICGGRTFEAIAFNYPLKELPAGKIDAAFTLMEDNWKSNASLQLRIQDIRKSQSA